MGLDAFTKTYASAAKWTNLGTLRTDSDFSLQCVDLAELPRAELTEKVAEVDVVFHLAAEPGVRASWGAGFDAYIRNNIAATQRLLEAIRAGNPSARIIVASSSSIYGDAEALPTSESATPKPRSPYGVTKLATEQLCQVYHTNFELPIVVLRYFSVYGPRQRPDMAFHRFIAQTMAGQPISLFGDGSQRRDFTFVADIVRATVAAARANSVVGRTMNIGSGQTITVNAVIDQLSEVAEAQLGRPEPYSSR